MPPSISPHCLSPIFIILVFVSLTSSQDTNTPFFTYCTGDNFTSPSPFESNLRSMITTLISSTPTAPSFFYTINSSSSPVIFGLAQCLPGITAAECAFCLNQSYADSSANPPLGCGQKKTVALRSLNCVLRFSDQQFNAILEAQELAYQLDVPNASDSFYLHVKLLMKSVMASAVEAAERFAVGVTNDSVDAQDIYGMTWCSMDLSSADCSQCLGMVFSEIPAGKSSGSGGTVSCMLRFNTSIFFSTSLLTQTASPPLAEGGKRRTDEKTTIFAGASGGVATLVFFIFVILLLLRQRKRKRKLAKSKVVAEEKLRVIEIRVFDFDAIQNATNNFAIQNKLGQGGFGPVYKGVLLDGQEIAVKRLSATSGQGMEEMKNEIDFIAKLHHINLVRLLGYCLEEKEKLLVYEFLPNKSLDKYLFDPIRRVELDWESRFKIILGVARGLLYLHEDSCLRIVHRDLKASNILLDSNMNPKISDFGLAKLFGVDETERNTSRVAGTLEYMAPEYVLHGLFSIKSDVFSYGVLVLEIITGEKKRTDGSDQSVDLLSYVWKHWKKGIALEVVDKSLGDRYSAQEALRCIQIGLLCVQEEQIQRPKMDSVTIMLFNSSMVLQTPSKPAFYSGKSIFVDSKSFSWTEELEFTGKRLQR